LKVLLLDAYNLIHRARSGFSQGEFPVMYNFFRGLRPIIEKFSPDKVYFVLEGDPKFRKNLSEGMYKQGRKNPGNDFHRQKAAIINTVSECFPFIVAKHPDLECDDTVATLVSLHASAGDKCTIVSSDSDFIQLLNYFDVDLYHPIKKDFIKAPDYDYVTWKALRGDPTDNIHGIRGIGDKTAQKLVKSPGDLREVLSDPQKREIFEKNVNLIRLVDFSNDLSMLEYTEGRQDFERLRGVFKDLGFESMLKEKTWQNFCQTFEGVNDAVFTRPGTA
tara:strand:+ start:581 stop:1408 length:828 start_codon:yes stop_codon:yes gene_type:complete